ncbi:hypothetical protein Axi01nite_71240 [Actinoplanes xinjiangensis]|nr:hypothetical protein Axi01nite_71240 [Actinoplanes xinjiangensis]
MKVLALIIITLLLLVAATAVLLPMPDAAAEDEVGAEDDAVGRDSAPTTLEGALTAQLLRGEINQRQYGRALGRLAARDDERNPMAVPGTDRPDATA